MHNGAVGLDPLRRCSLPLLEGGGREVPIQGRYLSFSGDRGSGPSYKSSPRTPVGVSLGAPLSPGHYLRLRVDHILGSHQKPVKPLT